MSSTPTALDTGNATMTEAEDEGSALVLVLIMMAALVMCGVLAYIYHTRRKVAKAKTNDDAAEGDTGLNVSGAVSEPKGRSNPEPLKMSTIVDGGDMEASQPELEFSYSVEPPQNEITPLQHALQGFLTSPSVQPRSRSNGGAYGPPSRTRWSAWQIGQANASPLGQSVANTEALRGVTFARGRSV
eukprot:TRINITY_DN13682_c0_g1_i1.p1 TRINITY_DN13682_c0_g1~~TRINITY_DN13682_c0_g1_i1.p1  ORF type:complete len:186 (+),score=27.79 TRINITY_DN13682_c0_g1_i1:153-710(+)